MNKLNKLSKVGYKHKADIPMNSIARQKTNSVGDRTRAFNLILEAQSHYFAMSKFRSDRDRNKRYTYGDQWSDVITTDEGRISEEAYISKQGNLPLKNNLIRRLVRNVIGLYRGQSVEPVCIARDRDEQEIGETMSVALQYNMQLNKMNGLYARSMEEFLISGFIVHRKSYGWRNGKTDCWTDYVQPNNFFIDSNIRDFRGWDCSFVGEIHDIDFNTLCERFASSPDEFKRLAEIYKYAMDMPSISTQWNMFGYSKANDISDFLMPTDHTRCRVIEIWKKESKPMFRCHDWNTGEIFRIDVNDYTQLVDAVNKKRIQMGDEAGMDRTDIPLIEAEWCIDSYWQYYFVTPTGEILAEGESPYAHGSHPYVFKAYPFIDGEIHSFVGDFIDQQRYTNRLISLYDWIMRASAKGVLMVPADSIPKGMSPETFADEWSRFNGVVIYEPSKSGHVPHQVSSNSTNIGISELLNLQLKLFEDISGVNGALQGKPGYSGMSASLYSQQQQNATNSLLDLLDSFSEFTKDAAYKDVKNIQQFYNNKKYINIVGKNAIIEYDPDKVKDIDFDLNIVPSTATPAYRSIANDFLIQIWSAGQISLEQLLENGSFPFSDRLLQSIKSQKEQLQNGETPSGVPQDILQQAQQSANQQAVNQLQQNLQQ